MKHVHKIENSIIFQKRDYEIQQIIWACLIFPSLAEWESYFWKGSSIATQSGDHLATSDVYRHA